MERIELATGKRVVIDIADFAELEKGTKIYRNTREYGGMI
jgi:hypothetical protein